MDFLEDFRTRMGMGVATASPLAQAKLSGVTDPVVEPREPDHVWRGIPVYVSRNVRRGRVVAFRDHGEITEFVGPRYDLQSLGVLPMPPLFSRYMRGALEALRDDRRRRG